jgi:alkanesulfonate monooxygenase SsuD/methylene tetrahydromethanopterin reductase-like flavin-dependent oxidoreductase (luciferase family)
MEFGIIPNWSWPIDGDVQKQADLTIEQARTAVENDIDAVWFGQHYISEGNNQFQPLPLMARTSEFAGSTDLGTSIFLLPLHNPIAVAENFATADALFDGKLLFGIALGYKPEEFDSFGIDMDDRLGRFVEGIQLLRKLWTEDNVSYSGEYFSVEDVTIDPKPNDGDGVPFLLGGNAEQSVRRAGKLGNGWIISARTTLDEAKEMSKAYQEGVNDSKYSNEGIAMNREVYVADTTEEAEETVKPMMKERAARWLERGAQDTAEQIDDLDEQVQEMLEERFIGSPEECIDRIAKYRDEVGVDHVITMYNWRQLPQEKTLESIRRFGEEVVPYFQDEKSDL